MKKKGRMISWLRSAVFPSPSPIPFQIDDAVPHQVTSPPRIHWTRKTIVMKPTNHIAIRYQKRQNQWRRRLRTSSSRTWSPSSANRLGCGMNLRKIRSSRPRNAKTAAAVATIAQPSAMPCDFHSQMNAAGAERTATNVAARRSERH